MNLNASLASLVNRLNASPTWVSLNIHGWLGCTVVYHVGRLTHHTILSAAIFAGATAAKEYYWDAKFESPPQKPKESTIDWVGYLLGTALAILLATL